MLMAGGCCYKQGSQSTIYINMTFENHIQSQVNKENKITGLIRRNFTYIWMGRHLCRLHMYKAQVRLHIEYVQAVQCQITRHIKIKLKTYKKEQHSYSVKPRKMEYEKGLQRLKLLTVAYRRLRSDMIDAYINAYVYNNKITTEMVSLQVTHDQVEWTTRGHCLKIWELKTYSKSEIRKNHFKNRIVNMCTCTEQSARNSGNCDGQKCQHFEADLDYS